MNHHERIISERIQASIAVNRAKNYTNKACEAIESIPENYTACLSSLGKAIRKLQVAEARLNRVYTEEQKLKPTTHE